MERLVYELFSRFGISFYKAIQLVTVNRDSVVKQLEYCRSEDLASKKGLIRAIERDYSPPPPAVFEAGERERKREVISARLVVIGECSFCNDKGLIEVIGAA